ncbi:MAG: DUF3486 family protein [Sphingomonadaceae bacterium]
MMTGRKDRGGRGRLSSIDMLPDSAEPEIEWALEQLRDRKAPQTSILVKFNQRLSEKGIRPVSKSAFSRYSVRKARQFRKLDEAQKMSSELVNALGTDGSDVLTVAVAEMVKTAALSMLEEDGVKSKNVLELSRAVASAVNAQRGSEDYRRRLEARVNEKLEKAADKAEEMAREAGLSAERIARLRRDFLGVKTGGEYGSQKQG